MISSLAPGSRMSGAGKVVRFHAERGWGFIDMNGVDVMVHVNDCMPEDVELFTGGQPKPGDWVTFELEPRKNCPEHMQAKRVVGGTDERCCNTKGKGQATPVPGTGQHFGRVRAFNAKGLGWITCADGSDAWVELNDCVGTRPVTGDKVQFDLEPCDLHPGKMRATSVTGGTAPMDLKDAILGKDMAKLGIEISVPKAINPMTLKKNANGHLIGCVCAACAQMGMSNVAMPTMPVTNSFIPPGPMPPGMVPLAMMNAHKNNSSSSSRPSPYSGGMGSMGRMY
eukprot:TRINITY_DN32417_c0_g1_i1.p1 TRINITY_DN32417_c0_g1~~TRINITY_DN32417_c0_g1_i1.p1  ORF type:complete len:282 (+),score=36.02 TRINITY_DN32417_c0_g1_i1:79-924(+)